MVCFFTIVIKFYILSLKITYTNSMCLRPLVGCIFISFLSAGFYAFAETNTSKQAAPQNSLNEMDVAKPPPIKEFDVKDNENLSIYGYRQAFSLSYGISSADGETDGLVSFEYQLPSDKANSWFAGADIIFRDEGAFHFGRKFVFSHLSTLRPYVKTAVSLRTDAGQGIAELVEFKNFHVMLSAGGEYLFLPPFSLRIEIDALAGLRESGYQAKMGLSWAWY